MNRNLKTAAALVATALVSTQGFAAGFEKSTMFSGKYAGMGNAATGNVAGAESVYFNPAGLTRGGSEISLNVSPTFSQYSGPITSTTANSSAMGLSPIFGAFASYKINEKLGLGLGAYVSGGSSSTFKDVAMPAALAPLGITAAFDLETALSLIEYSAAAAYEVIDGLSVGAAFRFGIVSAKLTSPGTTGSGGSTKFNVTTLSDLKGNAPSYRVGVQYAPKGGTWGVGVSLRGAAPFTTNGSFQTKSAGAGASTFTDVAAAAGGSGSATVTGELPLAYGIGGYWNAMSNLAIVAEYTGTNYNTLQKLGISVTPSLTNTAVSNDLTLNWKMQSNVRVGADYGLNDNWNLRGGYVLTTQVTDSEYSAASFVAPGMGHTITLGVGTSFLDKKLGVNLAGDYSTTSGSGKTNPTASGFSGDYRTNGYAAHLGINYAL